MSNVDLFLTVSLDPASSQTSYQQIVEQLKSKIAAGDLLSGEKIPSTRELAKSLGVSRTTTIKSYDILIAEGFLVTKPKQGVFVAELLPTLHVNDHESAAEVARKKLLNSDWVEKKEEIFLHSGADVNAFPNRAWAASMRRSWLNPDEKIMQGFYNSGLPELKRQLVDYLKNLRGLQCDEEQIIITAGNRDALSILTNALIESANSKQQTVWLETPCFPPIANVFSWLGGNVHNLPVDHEGATLPELQSTKRKQPNIALITPNRQYPLGTIMSSSRRQDWLSLLMNCKTEAEKTGNDNRLWLIEDDYDNEFLYHGRVGIPLMSLDASQSTFFIGSFSKVLFRSLRLGFIVAPKSKIEAIKVSQQQIGSSASLPMQAVLADFIETGGFSAHLRRMRRLYLDKRNYVNTILNKQLALYFTWQKPAGGMHTLLCFKPHWIKRHEQTAGVKNGTEPKELDQHIEECLVKRHIYISSLSKHYVQSSSLVNDDKAQLPQQGFVLGFTQTPKEKLKMALEILSQQVRNHFL
ncbi:PLP-dependent aminotransferase family protein [Marinomonas agarivorans]|nr:PLP-dependent aminotransferase family protein [Marinomonas agarivorans]